MGQQQSISIERDFSIFGKRDYTPISSQKPKIIAIFNRSTDLYQPITAHTIKLLSNHYEVSVCSYTVDIASDTNNVRLETSKYISIKQALDNADHLVFFTIVSDTSKNKNAFEKDGPFSLFYRYLLKSYPNYWRFGHFTLCILCQDFDIEGSPPMTLIYDNHCIELQNYDPSHPINYDKLIKTVYTDDPSTVFKQNMGKYWWVKPFACKFTYSRFYMGKTWIDEDVLMYNIQQGLTRKTIGM